MSDLVGNPEDRFSHNEAHIMPSMEIPKILLVKKMLLDKFFAFLLFVNSAISHFGFLDRIFVLIVPFHF